MDTGLRIAAICPVENRIDLSGRGIHPRFTLRAPRPQAKKRKWCSLLWTGVGMWATGLRTRPSAIDLLLTPTGYRAVKVLRGVGARKKSLPRIGLTPLE